MKPTAAQITEAQRIINQVGVPTEKVISDVAQLIAACDSWREECIRYHINEVVAPAGQPTPIEASRTVDAPASAEACHATRELRAENGRRLLANPREEFLTEEEIAAIIQRAIDAATEKLREELIYVRGDNQTLIHNNEALRCNVQKQTMNAESDKDGTGCSIGGLKAELTLLHESHDALAKEVEGLRADKARLDWLEHNLYSCTLTFQRYLASGSRQALDAAMTAQKGRVL